MNGVEVHQRVRRLQTDTVGILVMAFAGQGTVNDASATGMHRVLPTGDAEGGQGQLLLIGSKERASMNNSVQTVDHFSAEEIAQLEEHVECQLSGRIRDFHLCVSDDGLVLCGRAATYYAKQLAQHLVMRATDVPIRANDILVT